MISQYLQKMGYVETQPVFAQDALLQNQLADLSDAELLNIIDITGNCDHLNRFLGTQPAGNVLLQNLLLYYTELGVNNIFSTKNVRQNEQAVISLIFF